MSSGQIIRSKKRGKPASISLPTTSNISTRFFTSDSVVFIQPVSCNTSVFLKDSTEFIWSMVALLLSAKAMAALAPFKSVANPDITVCLLLFISLAVCSTATAKVTTFPFTLGALSVTGVSKPEAVYASPFSRTLTF